MKFMWVGPRKLTACRSDWVYEAEDILHGGPATVQAG